jgi:hypothetical protein
VKRESSLCLMPLLGETFLKSLALDWIDTPNSSTRSHRRCEGGMHPALCASRYAAILACVCRKRLLRLIELTCQRNRLLISRITADTLPVTGDRVTLGARRCYMIVDNRFYDCLLFQLARSELHETIAQAATAFDRVG